jgi:hypothetical protein
MLHSDRLPWYKNYGDFPDALRKKYTSLVIDDIIFYITVL